MIRVQKKVKAYLLSAAKVGICAAAAYSVFGLFTDRFPYSVVYNRSASIPLGLYLLKSVSPAEVKKGDIGCFTYEAPQWAQERKYFPPGYRLCKPVLAGPGTSYSIQDGRLHVDGKDVGGFAPKDLNGRTLPVALDAQGLVPQNSWMMIASEHDNSFDSRYLGLIGMHRVNYVATPIFTW